MRLLALLALLMLLAGPAAAQRTCDQARAAITAGTVATPSERVAGLPNKRIYICGWIVMPVTPPAAASLDFEITTGTGSNCATNKVILVPRMTVPSGGIVNRIPYVGQKTELGAAVCLQTWGNGSVTSIFYWAQF